MERMMLVAVAGSGTEKAAAALWSAAAATGGAASGAGSVVGPTAVLLGSCPGAAKRVHPGAFIFRLACGSCRLKQHGCPQEAKHVRQDCQEPPQQQREDRSQHQLPQYGGQAHPHYLNRYHSHAMQAQWDQQHRDQLYHQEYGQSKGPPHERERGSLHCQQDQKRMQQQKDQNTLATRHGRIKLSQHQIRHHKQQCHPRETALGAGLQLRRLFSLLLGREVSIRTCGYKGVCHWSSTSLGSLLPFGFCRAPARYVPQCRCGDATASAAPVDAVNLRALYTIIATRFARAGADAAASALEFRVDSSSEAVRIAPATASAVGVPALAAVQERRIASLAFPRVEGHTTGIASQPPFTAEGGNTKTRSEHPRTAQATNVLQACGAFEKHVAFVRLRSRLPVSAAAADQLPSSAQRHSVFSRASAATGRGAGVHATVTPATANAPRRTAATDAAERSARRAPAGQILASSRAPAGGAATARKLVKMLHNSTSHVSAKDSLWQAAGGLEDSCASPLPSRFDVAIAPGGWTCFTSAADEVSSSTFLGTSSCFRRFSQLLLCCCGGSFCLYLWMYFSLWKPLREQVGPPPTPVAAAPTATAVAAFSTASARTDPAATALASPAPPTRATPLGPARAEKHTVTRAASVSTGQSIPMEPPTTTGSPSTGVRPPKHVPMSLVPLYACSLLQHVGPFLLPLLERSRVCWQALDELEDPFLPREARSACLLALQAMLQTRGVADALSCSSSNRIYSSASHGNSLVGAGDNSSSQDSSGENSSSDGEEVQSSLCRMLDIFVRPPSAGVASTAAMLSSSDWLAALSCLLRLLDSTPVQRRQVPYELLQGLVNYNSHFWQQRPSLEELRALVLLKLLQNKENCLAVYNREYKELLQSKKAASMSASHTCRRLVLEYLLQRPPAPSVSSPAARQPQAEGLFSKLKHSLLQQQREVVDQVTTAQGQEPASYRLPSGWLYQYWTIGGRLRAGETHDILRHAVRQINRAVETSAAAVCAPSSTSVAAGAASAGFLESASAAAATAAAEGTVSESEDTGHGKTRMHTVQARRAGGQQEPEQQQNESLLPLLPVPDPLPRISPPLHLKQQLQEVELAAACTAAVVVLGLLSRRAAAGEMLPVGNASDIKKILLAFLRALRGLAVLEGVYRSEDIFMREYPAYYNDESFMVKADRQALAHSIPNLRIRVSTISSSVGTPRCQTPPADLHTAFLLPTRLLPKYTVLPGFVDAVGCTLSTAKAAGAAAADAATPASTAAGKTSAATAAELATQKQQDFELRSHSQLGLPPSATPLVRE